MRDTVWGYLASPAMVHMSSDVGAAVAEWFSPRTDNAEVPGSNPSHGSCALRQGALSSLPSLSEETLSRRSRV